MNIVYVYLNQKLPKYALKNILYFRSNFPNKKLIFISDLEYNIELIKSFGVETYLAEKPTLVWEELANYKSVDLNFRGGFWLSTLARFHALAQFMKTNPEQSVLQVECDVLLLPDFPFQMIYQTNTGIAFPIVNNTDAVPSLVFFKNASHATKLLEFMSRKMVMESHTTDMTILGQYSIDFPELVTILPTNFSTNFGYQPWVELDLKKRMSKNIGIYKGVFDAATWGQYLTGEDPRNTLGIRRVFHTLKHHAIDPSKFVWDFNESSGKITLSNGEEIFPLFCLHIHSKDLKCFEINPGRRIQKRINSLPRGQKLEYIDRTSILNFKLTTLKLILRARFLKLKKQLDTF